ncbi:hypothetical protein [Streptomyces kanasensis]|uniref:hypothetical protein n=1 Tax=Streptomyces kanasensis TaxID=936756 RepID=UPI0036F6BFBF
MRWAGLIHTDAYPVRWVGLIHQERGVHHIRCHVADGGPSAGGGMSEPPPAATGGTLNDGFVAPAGLGLLRP